MNTQARTLPRVVLVDDHSLFRSGVRAEIGHRVEVVGEADDVGPAIELIVQVYTYKEIARELYISVKTVESHVSSVLRKLQLSSRHQLTRWAAERRLT